MRLPDETGYLQPDEDGQGTKQQEAPDHADQIRPVTDRKHEHDV
jgi:hypothetical protein